MQTREDLIKESIELERTAMKFKKGLHLAKKCIDENNSFDSVLSSKAQREFDKYITDNGLQEI